jgi:hypothetical protein
MKKRAVLLTILVSVFLFGACSSQPPIAKVTPTPTPIIANPTPPPASEWVYYYDVDTEGYPFYPEKHKKHRKGSKRWYPNWHPQGDPNYKSFFPPRLKLDVDLSDVGKFRYLKENPNAIEDVTNKADLQGSVYMNIPTEETRMKKLSETLSSESRGKTTSPDTNKKKTTASGSDDDYYGSTTSNSKRKSSTSYGSSYPDYSSSSNSTAYSTRSSYPSTSSTPYRSSSSSSSSSSTTYKSSTTTRTRRR